MASDRVADPTGNMRRVGVHDQGLLFQSREGQASLAIARSASVLTSDSAKLGLFCGFYENVRTFIHISRAAQHFCHLRPPVAIFPANPVNMHGSLDGTGPSVQAAQGPARRRNAAAFRPTAGLADSNSE